MERRTTPRIPLDMPYVLTLVIEGGQSLPVMLTDISIGGMKLTLPPAATGTELINNTRVSVKDFPPQVARELDGSTGTIVWVVRNQCGIHLDKPISCPLELIVGANPP